MAQLNFMIMVNYEKLIEKCQVNTKIASSVIDDFLIPYCASNTNLPKLADKSLGSYSHVTRSHKDWFSLFKSQHIVHQIFKEGGTGRKLINHSTVKEQLNQEELYFFKDQLANPWRFSFSEIIDNPKENFFKMFDIFREEEFLLYSPSVQEISEEHSIQLWLNLIQYNGSCWQSFGPIGSYNSFNADDIYFFATELDPAIESDQDIANHIEKDPAPYMMLFSGSRYPEIYSKEHQTKHLMTVYDKIKIDFEKLEEHFEIESNSKIYRFKDPELHLHPHFAFVYYNSDTEELIFEAMTEHGFVNIFKLWNKAGYDLFPLPDLCVKPSMLTTAQQITRKKAEISPYASYFDNEEVENVGSSPSTEEIKKINEFMQLALPMANSGRKPDIAKLAKQVNLDESIASQVFEQMMERIEEMRNNIR